jgi:hypothetical protein
MRVTTQLRSTRSCVVRTLALAGLLAAVGGVGAQERPMGQLDGACASDCTARGYASGYCAQVCWIPDRPRSPPDEVTDWSCMTAWAERGGKYAECNPRCRAR